MTVNVMWNGTCQYLPFADQLRTTRLAGCEVLSITPLHYLALRTQGLSTSDLRSMADDEGVRLSHLDPLCTWAGEWRPDNVADDALPFFQTPVEEFLAIADDLGCESMSAICTAPVGSLPLDHLVQAFGDLCAAASGLRVDLEFIPIWGLPDLKTAWEVVRSVDAPNGGVMIDFWHFFRGDPDFELLESIPAAKIHSVQACDASLSRRSDRSALQDILEDRLPLGAGEFDVDRLLDVLAAKGALGVVGPEYYSEQMRGLTPEQIAGVVEATYWPRMRPLGVQPRPSRPTPAVS